MRHHPRSKLGYKRRSEADICLGLLDHAVENDTYASVLSTLGTGVNAATDTMEKAARKGSEDYSVAVAGDQVEIIEGLLGTAYVLCQTPIAAVVQAALRVRKQALSDGLAFSAFGENKHDVRSLGDRFDNTTYSKVEVLWALANYFKHGGEWGLSVWDNPTGVAKYTVPVIKAAGLEPRRTGNVSTGAGALGNHDYADMSVFKRIVQCWADEVQEVTRSAFGR